MKRVLAYAFMWLILCAVIGAGIGTCRAECPDPNQFQNWKPVYVEESPDGMKMGVTIVNPDKTASLIAAILIIDQSGRILIFATWDGLEVKRYALTEQGYEETPMEAEDEETVADHFKRYAACKRQEV